MIETMGMTDLQFKSWLKQIIRGLESAKDEPNMAAIGADAFSS